MALHTNWHCIVNKTKISLLQKMSDQKYRGTQAVCYYGVQSSDGKYYTECQVTTEQQCQAIPNSQWQPNMSVKQQQECPNYCGTQPSPNVTVPCYQKLK